MLIRGLSADSRLAKDLNGGQRPWGNVEHLLADLWALILRVNSGKDARFQDHPTRAEMEAKAHADAKQARVAELKSRAQKLKRTYGLG